MIAKNVGILTHSYSVTYVKGQKYSASLSPGTYLIECWGASGSHDKIKEGGNGAYVRGYIRFLRQTTVYLFAGESGQTYGDVTYNGGGSGLFRETNSYWEQLKGIAKCGSGGGASDVRLIDGEWNNTESLKSRIIVAAGGGGYVNYNNNEGDVEVTGSSGGALHAKQGSYSQCVTCSDESAGYIRLAEGGSQTKGSSTVLTRGGLGYGGNSNDAIGGGGGGGYFGGDAGYSAYHRYGSGAGGSSFISGHSGCYAFPEKSSEETSSLTNIHYSGLYFTDTQMKSGDETFLSPDGRNETGHTGNGYISIKAISLIIQTQSFKTIRIPYSLLFILLIK